MSRSLADIQKLLPDCCEVDGIDRSRLTDEEKAGLSEFSSDFNTVLVFAHHVCHSWEWTWFEFASARGGAIPPADLHLVAEIEKVKSMLTRAGYAALTLPYPGRCGVRFKIFADKTGMGKMGDNFLFLHRNWGPWVHLRVVLTDAEISDFLPICEPVCIHCGKCAKACPSGALQKNLFNGKRCGEYQHHELEHRERDAATPQCSICVRACPLGTCPTPIRVEFSN